MTETALIFMTLALAIVAIVAISFNKNVLFKKKGNDIEMQIKNEKEN